MDEQTAPLIITPRTVRRPAPGSRGILSTVPFVAVDVETTGTSSVCRVIEVAAARFAPDGTVMDTFSSLVNPGRQVPMNKAAVEVHGISPEQVWAAPPPEEVYGQFRDFVAGNGLVAHNLSFENRFLSAEYQRLNQPAPQWQGVCTLAAARTHFRAESNKLSALIDLFELSAVNTHRALDDAKACGLLLAAMMRSRHLTDLDPLDRATTSKQESTQPPEGSSRERIAVAETPTTAQITSAFGGNAPTDEQVDILDTFQSGEQLTVSACAGSGKTSTMLGLAHLEAARNPQRRGLYLAFNATVAKEAKQRFPRQVQSSTAHALAFGHFKSGPQADLLGKLNAPRPRWKDTIEALAADRLWLPEPMAGPRALSAYAMARLALATVSQFCRTTDEGIGPQHVPERPGIEGDNRDAVVDYTLPLARRAWRLVMDPQRFEVQFQHDHYLKMWADTGPKVGRDGDYLVIDEAQDLNPILREIVLSQTHLQRVMVGDSAQAIYGFTGARDALHDVPDATERALTQSWRFGDTIAEAANVYLELLEETMRVRGNPHRNSRLLTAEDPVDAVLCRTNADAISEIIDAQKMGRKTALEGDRAAALRFCDSAEQLQSGQSATDPMLAAFSSWTDLVEYAENTPGASEVSTLVSLVEDNGLPLVRAAMEHLVPRRQANLLASTVHKAKGGEFPKVRINHNWEIDSPGTDVDNDAHRAELMLAYVGLTRAKDGLDPGQLLDQGTVSRLQPDLPGTPTATDGGLFEMRPAG